MNNVFVHINLPNNPPHCQLAAVFFEPSTGRTGETFIFEGSRSPYWGIFPHETILSFEGFLTSNLRHPDEAKPTMWFGSGMIDYDILITDFYAHKITPPWFIPDFRDHATLLSVAQAGGWDGYLPLQPSADITKHVKTCAALISEAWQHLTTPHIENWRHESEYTPKKQGVLQ